MSLVETIEHKNHRIEIHYDMDPSNPREDLDPGTTMVCFHGRYNLDNPLGYRSEDFAGWQEVHDRIVADHSPVFIAPVYMYEHSGVALRIGRGGNPFSAIDFGKWDSGQVGFIFITPAQQKMMGTPDDKLAEVAAAEVETYSDYLNGSVYGYVIYGPPVTCDQGHEHREEVDSCWGFYGYEYVIEEAKEACS